MKLKWDDLSTRTELKILYYFLVNLLTSIRPRLQLKVFSYQNSFIFQKVRGFIVLIVFFVYQYIYFLFIFTTNKQDGVQEGVQLELWDVHGSLAIHK